LRWCSDGFELGCDNGEKVRVAFALDCCDHEALGYVATAEGIKSEDVQNLTIAAVEHHFGTVNRLLHTIEWLTDNASCYVAGPTRALARSCMVRHGRKFDPQRRPSHAVKASHLDSSRIPCVSIR
jgi:putative transposase